MTILVVIRSYCVFILHLLFIAYHITQKFLHIAFSFWPVPSSYSILNFDFYDKQEDLPFKRDKLYKLTYKADENMSYFWCVAKIEDVTTLPDDKVPEVFRKWQGESKALSSCNRVSF